MKSKIIIIFTIGFLLLLSGACDRSVSISSPVPGIDGINTPQSTKTSLTKEFFNGVCKAPCWENITPGISTQEDVIRTIERLTSEKKIENYSQGNGGFSLYFQDGGSVDIPIESGHVHLLVINLAGSDVTVEDAIRNWGVQDGVIKTLEGQGPYKKCDQWDDQIYQTSTAVYPQLLYPSKGINATVSVPVDYINSICPRMELGPFYYYHSISLEEGLKDPQNLLFLPHSHTGKDIIPWHGYGPGY